MGLLLLVLVLVTTTYVGRCYWGPQVYSMSGIYLHCLCPLQTAFSIHLFPPLQRDLTRTEPPSLRVRVDSSPFPSVRVSSFCPEFGLLAVSFQQVVAASLFTLFRIVVLADSGSATA